MSDFNFDDLTEEEIYKLRKNTNPDEIEAEKYNWTEEFQKNIISLLLCDRWFAVQCRDLVNPNYFVDEVHQLLGRVLFNYLDTYKSLPEKSFVMQEVDSAIKKKEPKIKQHYIAETNLVYEKYVPNLESRPALLDKILNFAKLMALKSAFDTSLNLMKKDPEEESTWIKIQNTLKEALLVDRNFNEGLNYFETFEERYERMESQEESKEIFTTGFDGLDDALLGGGTHRGEIYAWVGLSGTGKSLALVSAAKRNVTKYNKKVLYVSLEMDEDKIAERFDAQFAGVNINRLYENKDKILQKFDQIKEENEDPKMLVVKQFPAGSMTVNTLKAYMQQLQMTGFKPDLVIVDYIGEMKDYPGMATWESRYRIVRDLRGLATEENVCIFTALQPNKSAREAQKMDGPGEGVIDDDNLADSYGQIRPLDGCWSINQMQVEKDAGIARIFVIKHRHGKSRFTIWVGYDRDTLAMDQITHTSYEKKLHQKHMKASEKVQEDVASQAAEINKVLGKGKKNFFADDMGHSNEDPDAPDDL